MNIRQKETPLISVVIPVHNAENYLEETLGYLQKQTMGDFEVICVDDGSIDNSVTILKRISDEDTRFSFIRQEAHGAGRARNVGMERARGKYIIFLDADDIFHPELLEAMSSLCIQTGCDVCICDINEYREDQQKIRSRIAFSTRKDGRAYNAAELKGDVFRINSAPWNKMFPLAFVKKTGIRFQEIQNSNDVLFTNALLSQAQSVAFARKALVTYRVNAKANSLQSSKSKYPLCVAEAAVALHDCVLENGPLDEDRLAALNERCVHGLISAVENASINGDCAHEAYRVLRESCVGWGLSPTTSRSFRKRVLRYKYRCFFWSSEEGFLWAYKHRNKARFNTFTDKAVLAIRLCLASAFTRREMLT